MRYLGEGEYVKLPEVELGEDLTIEGWFVWMSGGGPLYATVDGGFVLGYDRRGQFAYRLGGFFERVTTIPVQSLRNRWIYLVLAKAGPDVTLRIDSDSADHWSSAPPLFALGEAVAMKDAVGFAADIAYYPSRLPDDRLDLHWNTGKNRI